MEAAVLPIEKLPFFELEKLYQFYQNSYGHFQPATLARIAPLAKVQRINAVNAAYLGHSQRFIQQQLNF
jgi:hypothetical protein